MFTGRLIFFSLFALCVTLANVGVCADSCEKAGSFSSKSQPKVIIQEIFSFADIQFNGTRPWDITVHNENFYERVLSQGSLGLGESYMDGWWDSKALDETMFRILRANLDKKVKFSWPRAWAFIKGKLFNMQDKARSMEVIKEHYQL